MDIYLRDLETGDTLRFPMLPEQIACSMGNGFASYSLLGIGELKVPSGQNLDVISWEGMFPSESRKDMPYVRQWIAPLEAYRWLENCKVALPRTKKLNLLVTETALNLDVYLESFRVTHSGGMGDIFYSISFVEGKDLLVTASSSTQLGLIEEAMEDTRYSYEDNGTYTVVKGDSLWGIAQKFYGAGSRYEEIYTANQSTIDAGNALYGNSKYTIYPSQVFRIP